MNQKWQLYIPLIIGAVIIIIALLYIFVIDKDNSNNQIPVSTYDNSSNAAASTSTPSTTNAEANSTTATNTMPPPVPQEPTMPETPVAPENISMPPANTASTNCIDTDGGIAYTIKGTVSLLKNSTVTNYTDYCRHGVSEGNLIEFSCANNSVVTTNYKCPKGCNNNGACY